MSFPLSFPQYRALSAFSTRACALHSPPGEEWNAQTLVENADRALYWAKESGKNMIRVYPPGKEVADA